MQLPSTILSQAVDALSTLPGVGKRSALRFALHLLKQPTSEVLQLSESISKLATDIHYCQICHCISDTDICPICASPKRVKSIVCVVENVQDVMAIENTQQYQGLYHVLGGVISPIDGISPRDLNTNYYLNRQLQPLGVKVTTIARGIAIGDNLEYADEITLGRSIVHRVPFE